MRGRNIAARALAPVIFAGVALGLLGAPAYAEVADYPHPGSPVTLKQCRAGGGVVVRDRIHRRQFHCQRGRYAGRPIRW
jgi:hypothetical protein